MNNLLESIASLASELLTNVFLYGLGGAFMGLLISILIVKFCRRKGWLNRSNSFWTFLVKCNYVLFPIAMLLVGLTQGGVYGAHTTTEDWVKQSTDPIIDYAAGYLPEIQNFVNTQLDTEVAQGMTLEQLVDLHGGQSSGMVQSSFNIFLLQGALDMFSTIPGEVLDPVYVIKNMDLRRLKRADFEILPVSINAVASFYFAAWYWAFFAPFGMYFLIVFGEIFLYRKLFASAKEYQPAKSYENSYQELFV